MSRPRAKDKTPQFSFRLDPSLRADLKLLADADGRSLGYYIERTMRKHRDDHISHVRKLREKDGSPSTTIARVGYSDAAFDSLKAAEPDSSYGEPAGQNKPTPQPARSSDQAKEEERRIDRMLAKEQRKKDSAPREPKPAAPGKASAKAGEST